MYADDQTKERKNKINCSIEQWAEKQALQMAKLTVYEFRR